MKKNFPSAVVLIMVVLCAACKMQEPPQKIPPVAELVKFMPKLGDDLAYNKYPTDGKILEVNILKEGTDKRLLWFQMLDQRNNAMALNMYMRSKEKIGAYPAIIDANKWVWILVNKIEIKLMADPKAKDYQDTEKLKKFLMRFDLAGLEKY